MHYRSSTFPVLDGQFNVPHFQFNEGLHLEENGLLESENFLRKLRDGLEKSFVTPAQEKPELLAKYRQP